MFHGPTLAFKDLALGVVGGLYNYFLERSKKKCIVIVGIFGWLAAFSTRILIEILQSSVSAVRKRCRQNWIHVLRDKNKPMPEEVFRNSDRISGCKSSRFHPYRCNARNVICNMVSWITLFFNWIRNFWRHRKCSHFSCTRIAHDRYYSAVAWGKMH